MLLPAQSCNGRALKRLCCWMLRARPASTVGWKCVRVATRRRLVAARFEDILFAIVIEEWWWFVCRDFATFKSNVLRPELGS